MITVDFLKQELASVQQQQVNAMAVVQQAQGAISLLESLIQKATEQEMTLDEFKDSLGAVSAEVV